MFSMQKLLGKGDEFFDLLEASAQKSCECVEHLKSMLNDPSKSEHLTALKQARMDNKEITEKIDELVVRSFVTIIEREDIEALARALYKIPKPITKFAERFTILKSKVDPKAFQSQVIALDTACNTVLKMVKELRKGNNLARVKGFNARLQEVEAEADILELHLIGDLYNSNDNPMQVLIMSDLYSLLEKVVDLCRNTGNVITHIFLKNS